VPLLSELLKLVRTHSHLTPVLTVHPLSPCYSPPNTPRRSLAEMTCLEQPSRRRLLAEGSIAGGGAAQMVSSVLLYRDYQRNPGTTNITLDWKSARLYPIPSLIYLVHNNVQFLTLKCVACSPPAPTLACPT
jgi:hypothetical protein